MKKVNEFFETLFNFLPGYIFGFLTFFISFLGNVIALLLSPEYRMWQNSISMLSIAAGGIYLRIGLIISNVIAIFFIIYLGRALRDENVNEIIRKITIGAGIFSSISAILIGAIAGTNPLISILHGLFALLSWLGGSVTCLLFGFLMLKNLKFSKFITYVSFVVAGLFISFLIPFFITNFCSYFKEICYTFGQRVYVIMPVYEWIVNFSILLWYLFNSSYMLHKKI